MRQLLTAYLCLSLSQAVQPLRAQTTPTPITIHILNDRHPVSPYLYGRNNSLSDNPANPVTTINWQRYKDAGVNFFRENGGNNLTKYNWRNKLSSHPDWYNNVYPHDWDFAAQSLQQNIPAAQGMWGFQLIGQTAANNTNNFDDWNFNGSQWWSGVAQNLAGGGTPNTAGGSVALSKGDTSRYLQQWPADSTTALLDHWFGGGGLGLDPTKITYWNMDNEVEIWSSTHDDVMPVQPSAEAFMQLYFAVAKKARALFPGIRLTGPVSPNEWQWFNWNNATVTGSDGHQYPWLEFFIKRVAEEQQATGIRLLDVIDLHFYPGSSNAADVMQYHRVFFDSTYHFPEANGVKVVNGSWDNSIQIEDVFGRCRNWLNQYMGPANGVSFAVSETATQLHNNPNALAVWYASMMGEFMNQGVEFFAPWNWDTGMWETLHLFSRYNKNNSIQATSGDETNVSAYTTIDDANDSMTVALVNRSLTNPMTVTLNFPDFLLSGQPVTSLTLSNLPPGTETFVSHSNNALVTNTITPQPDNTLQVTLAPTSVTSLIITGATTPLPVTLLSFTASKVDNSAMLNFSTTNEVSIADFVIERSGDGSAFVPIGTVPAGDGPEGDATASYYSFRDDQPLPSINFYRLKMIDQDGRSTYSKTVAIRFDNNSGAGAGLILFPNPANQTVTVQLQQPAGPVLLQLIDLAGRTIKTLQWQSTGTPLSGSIDISGLTRGQYYIVTAGQVQSFIKQ